MRVVFAAPAGQFGTVLEAAGVQHYLATYYNPADYRAALKVAAAAPGTCTLIVDSGAFSAWNSGKAIDIHRYVAFIRRFVSEHGALFKELTFVNLDVIPGTPGCTITQEQGRDAAAQSYQNYAYLVKETPATIMPVYHQGEDLAWCERYLESAPAYFGISPSNDIQSDGRARWLDQVFRIIPDTVRTHGLAVTSPMLMHQYPWFSVDSITYKMKAAVGGMMLFMLDEGEPVFLNFDHSAQKDDLPRGPGARAALERSCVALDPRFTLAALRESYLLRTALNVQTLLTLERWLNAHPCPRRFAQQLQLEFS